MIINETMPIVTDYSSNETIMSDCSSNEMEAENFNLKHKLNMVLSLKKKVKCYTKRLNYLNEISQKNLKDIEQCCDELIHHFKDEKTRKGVIKTFNSKNGDVLGSIKAADGGIRERSTITLVGFPEFARIIIPSADEKISQLKNSIRSGNEVAAAFKMKKQQF